MSIASSGGTAGEGTMTNQGEWILGSIRSLDGSFVQSATGMFTSALFGTSSYGSLTMAGRAAFDGTLNLEHNGLSLAVGQTFDLLAFASETGSFQSLAVDGVGLVSLGTGQWACGSLILQEAWTPSSFRIDVLAGPCSALSSDVGFGRISPPDRATWSRRSRAREAGYRSAGNRERSQGRLQLCALMGPLTST